MEAVWRVYPLFSTDSCNHPRGVQLHEPSLQAENMREMDQAFSGRGEEPGVKKPEQSERVVNDERRCASRLNYACTSVEVVV